LWPTPVVRPCDILVECPSSLTETCYLQKSAILGAIHLSMASGRSIPRSQSMLLIECQHGSSQFVRSAELLGLIRAGMRTEKVCEKLIESPSRPCNICRPSILKQPNFRDRFVDLASLARLSSGHIALVSRDFNGV
jgi:hypothetical protein